MKKSLIFFFFFALFSIKGNCQLNLMGGVTPMHNFFKEFADSTVIIEYPTQSYEPSTYRIISKKAKIINCFLYLPVDNGLKKLYETNLPLPDTLKAFLQMRKNNFKNSTADINVFFNFVEISPDTAKTMWQTISKFKPWTLVDDKSYPECSAVIMDASYSIMHLITKKEIKTLVYYAPFYYERQCPGNINRQGIIGVQNVFSKYFPASKGTY